MIQIDMPMPEKCGLCPCFHAENPMYCQAVKADKNKMIVSPYGASRPEWCPLKEQEAAKPRRIDGKRNHFIKCGNCNYDLVTGFQFCPHCGQAVKWE